MPLVGEYSILPIKGGSRSGITNSPKKVASVSKSDIKIRFPSQLGSLAGLVVPRAPEFLNRPMQFLRAGTPKVDGFVKTPFVQIRY